MTKFRTLVLEAAIVVASFCGALALRNHLSPPPCPSDAPAATARGR